MVRSLCRSRPRFRDLFHTVAEVRLSWDCTESVKSHYLGSFLYHGKSVEIQVNPMTRWGVSSVATEPPRAVLRNSCRPLSRIDECHGTLFGAEEIMKGLMRMRIFLDKLHNSEGYPQYLSKFPLPIFWRLRSKKLTNIASFRGFEHALALALTESAIFFAETAFVDTIPFKNCFKWSLLVLKCARKSIVSIAS